VQGKTLPRIPLKKSSEEESREGVFLSRRALGERGPSLLNESEEREKKPFESMRKRKKGKGPPGKVCQSRKKKTRVERRVLNQPPAKGKKALSFGGGNGVKTIKKKENADPEKGFLGKTKGEPSHRRKKGGVSSRKKALFLFSERKKELCGGSAKFFKYQTKGPRR